MILCVEKKHPVGCCSCDAKVFLCNRVILRNKESPQEASINLSKIVAKVLRY
jgi:hypothetical protein